MKVNMSVEFGASTLAEFQKATIDVMRYFERKGAPQAEIGQVTIRTVANRDQVFRLEWTENVP